MIEEGLLLPLNLTWSGKCFVPHEPVILLVLKNQNPDVQLQITLKNQRYPLNITNDGLLLCDRCTITVLNGPFIYRKLNIDILAKLLAFVDVASSWDDVYFHSNDFTCLELQQYQFLSDRKRSEAWLLRALLRQEAWVSEVCCFIRRTECYKLVKYLLTRTTATHSLHELGEKYGLSYSHFRRLCKSALGGKVKAELCSWRMARSVLEIVEGENDMTTIAHKYGYSSSSHFSSEVKSKFGKSPRELCRRNIK